MKIIISGASGLLGTALTNVLRAEGDTVKHLVRTGRKAASPADDGDIQWDPTSARVDVPALEGADAVVHLSGAERRRGPMDAGAEASSAQQPSGYNTDTGGFARPSEPEAERVYLRVGGGVLRQSRR